jgi:phage replication-related protein YjqB (UPF0714/DUF867 family)
MGSLNMRNSNPALQTISLAEFKISFPGRMDKYLNYAELKKNEKEEKDYVIRYRKADSEIAVMAPHGGGIEPGTNDLADEVAGNNFLFYSFSGIKKRRNSVLHIGSTRFDEPEAFEIARRAYTVITIHGCKDSSEIIYTGGKDGELIHAVSTHLSDAGFNVRPSYDDDLKGKSDYNICNRGRSGKGVQLEISIGLRQRMFDFSDCFCVSARTEIFYKFVSTVRGVLLSVQK